MLGLPVTALAIMPCRQWFAQHKELLLLASAMAHATRCMQGFCLASLVNRVVLLSKSCNLVDHALASDMDHGNLIL